MGRVKSVAIKTLGDELLAAHADRFSNDFEKNKIAIKELQPLASRRTRNTVAGYITSKKKEQ